MSINGEYLLKGSSLYPRMYKKALKKRAYTKGRCRPPTFLIELLDEWYIPDDFCKVYCPNWMKLTSERRLGTCALTLIRNIHIEEGIDLSPIEYICIYNARNPPVSTLPEDSGISFDSVYSKYGRSSPKKLDTARVNKGLERFIIV